MTFLCCCDNSLFEENRRAEKRERREKRKESEGRKNETERTKRKKQGGKKDKKEKKEKEASNAERGERRQAKRARRADKQKGRQDRRETEKSVGGSMMSKHMNSTSGSVGPGGGITAKVCDFGLASSSYRTTASHHFGQLWSLIYIHTNNQVNQANKPVYVYYKIANVQHKQHGNEQNSVYMREQNGSWDIQP